MEVREHYLVPQVDEALLSCISTVKAPALTRTDVKGGTKTATLLNDLNTAYADCRSKNEKVAAIIHDAQAKAATLNKQAGTN